MATFKYIHEVLLETCKLENREDRIKYLQENAYKQVKSVLQLCYNDRIQLDLPKGKGPRSDRTKVLNKIKAYLKTV